MKREQARELVGKLLRIASPRGIMDEALCVRIAEDLIDVLGSEGSVRIALDAALNSRYPRVG